jgi:hypothetical protein
LVMGLQVLALAGKYKLFRGGTEFPWGFKPNYSIAITIPHGMEVGQLPSTNPQISIAAKADSILYAHS